jgi:nucleoside-diphosphate-sugar epimerase
MNVLITGASGFLGTNLLSILARERGVHLFAHTRQKQKLVASDQQIQVLSDLSAATFNTHQINAVIHLAGIAHDLSGKFKESDYMAVNYHNTARLYDEFLKSDATFFIFVSSIKAVIDKCTETVTEATPAHPATAYGASKWKAEQYLNAHPLPGKQVFILRPCMVHGPGNKGNLNSLFRFVKWGIPYPLGKFINKRSFLSVHNFAFIVSAILKGNVQSGTYNLCDSDSISTVELVQMMYHSLGRKPRVWYLPKSWIKILFFFKQGMIGKLTENMVISNQKICAQVGPLPVSLRDGLMQTISHFNG